MGRTFSPERAEQEANKIGLEFANSNDVVKDMSRVYHVDFSNIRVHTDSAADSKVKSVGKDALAQGNDIFFGKGIFESSDPADKGLVAHEFAHTMQQGTAMGGEMAVTETAPIGAAQGGIIDWFKKHFGSSRRRPTLLDTPEKAKAEGGYKLNTETDSKLRFMSTQSRAIYEMVQNASPEQLRNDPMLRQLIMDDYQKNMALRLQGFEEETYNGMFSKIFRGDTAGELKTYNMLLNASMPENMLSEISEIYRQNPSEDALLGYAGERILNDTGMMEVLQAGMAGFGTSSHFSGENEGRRSGMLMNNLVLRGIAPRLAKQGFAAQQDYITQHSGGRKLTDDEYSALEREAKGQGIGMSDMKASIAMQKAVKEGAGLTEAGKKFRGLLNRLFR